MSGDDDTDPKADDWRDRLTQRAGEGGGCMELARAAREERHRERTDTRRGLVRKIGTAIVRSWGLEQPVRRSKPLPSGRSP